MKLLVFVTSIRHPLNSNSYAEVSRLFENSLRTVCNQTDPGFRVIVVCNALPEVTFESSHVEYVLVDFPPPSRVGGPQTGLEAVRRDKGTKYTVGILASRKYQPDYVMFFDADDYVHRDIAGFCNDHPGRNGWFVSSGYSYREGGVLYHPLENFHKCCGTCNLVSFQLLMDNLPAGLNEHSSQDDIVGSVDEYFLNNILGAHPFTDDFFRERGTPLEPLPFPGAIYVLGTGENHSGINVLSGFPRPLSRKLIDQFCMNLQLSLPRMAKRLLVDYPPEIYRTLRYGWYRERMRQISHLGSRKA